MCAGGGSRRGRRGQARRRMRAARDRRGPGSRRKSTRPRSRAEEQVATTHQLDPQRPPESFERAAQTPPDAPAVDVPIGQPRPQLGRFGVASLAWSPRTVLFALASRGALMAPPCGSDGPVGPDGIRAVATAATAVHVPAIDRPAVFEWRLTGPRACDEGRYRLPGLTRQAQLSRGAASRHSRGTLISLTGPCALATTHARSHDRGCVCVKSRPCTDCDHGWPFSRSWLRLHQEPRTPRDKGRPAWASSCR